MRILFTSIIFLLFFNNLSAQRLKVSSYTVGTNQGFVWWDPTSVILNELINFYSSTFYFIQTKFISTGELALRPKINGKMIYGVAISEDNIYKLGRDEKAHGPHFDFNKTLDIDFDHITQNWSKFSCRHNFDLL